MAAYGVRDRQNRSLSGCYEFLLNLPVMPRHSTFSRQRTSPLIPLLSIGSEFHERLAHVLAREHVTEGLRRGLNALEYVLRITQ